MTMKNSLFFLGKVILVFSSTKTSIKISTSSTKDALTVTLNMGKTGLFTVDASLRDSSRSYSIFSENKFGKIPRSSCSRSYNSLYPNCHPDNYVRIHPSMF